MAAALALALAPAGCGGGGAKGGCQALERCGGNPAGMWKVSDVCQYQAVRPAQPVDTSDFTNMTPPLAPTLAPPQANPVLLQQTTSGDWCSSLVVTPDGRVANAALWHQAPRLTGGNMFFATDHSYLTKLTYSTPDAPGERDVTHFAPRCLMANGGNPTCADLKAGLDAFYAPAMMTVPATFQQIDCVAASDGGCDCSYVYVVEVDDTGTWLVDGDKLLQDSTIFTFNGATAFPQTPSRTIETTFCAAGGLLQLTGPNGGAISGLQGLRTLVLTPTQ